MSVVLAKSKNFQPRPNSGSHPCRQKEGSDGLLSWRQVKEQRAHGVEHSAGKDVFLSTYYLRLLPCKQIMKSNHVS